MTASPVLVLDEGLAGGSVLELHDDVVVRRKRRRADPAPEIVHLGGLAAVSARIRRWGTSEVTATIGARDYKWLFNDRSQAQRLHAALLERLRPA